MVEVVHRCGKKVADVSLAMLLCLLASDGIEKSYNKSCDAPVCLALGGRIDDISVVGASLLPFISSDFDFSPSLPTTTSLMRSDEESLEIL